MSMGEVVPLEQKRMEKETKKRRVRFFQEPKHGFVDGLPVIIYPDGTFFSVEKGETEEG